MKDMMQPAGDSSDSYNTRNPSSSNKVTSLDKDAVGDDDSQDNGGDTNYLQQIVDAMTPQERQELDMILKSAMQKDRMNTTVNLENIDEDSQPSTPIDAGTTADTGHMQEIGR